MLTRTFLSSIQSSFFFAGFPITSSKCHHRVLYRQCGPAAKVFTGCLPTLLCGLALFFFVLGPLFILVLEASDFFPRVRVHGEGDPNRHEHFQVWASFDVRFPALEKLTKNSRCLHIAHRHTSLTNDTHAPKLHVFQIQCSQVLCVHCGALRHRKKRQPKACASRRSLRRFFFLELAQAWQTASCRSKATQNTSLTRIRHCMAPFFLQRQTTHPFTPSGLP